MRSDGDGDTGVGVVDVVLVIFLDDNKQIYLHD